MALASVPHLEVGTIVGVDHSLTSVTSCSVLRALESLGDACAYDYLEVAFAELTDWNEEVHETILEPTVERIEHVSDDDLLTAHAQRCVDDAVHLSLAEGFMVTEISRPMAQDQHKVLASLVDM